MSKEDDEMWKNINWYRVHSEILRFSSGLKKKEFLKEAMSALSYQHYNLSILQIHIEYCDEANLKLLVQPSTNL